jgi:sugar lactone lactonase YvrE
VYQQQPVSAGVQHQFQCLGLLRTELARARFCLADLEKRALNPCCVYDKPRRPIVINRREFVAAASGVAVVGCGGAGGGGATGGGASISGYNGPTRWEVSPFAGYYEGNADGTGTAAQFHSIAGIAIDAAGQLYVADVFNNNIRKISPDGVVSTLAGAPNQLSGSADGTGTGAYFDQPHALALHPNGRFYVADGVRVRECSTDGKVKTIAGVDNAGDFADGHGTAALFRTLTDLAVDNQGHLLVTDSGNHVIRQVTTGGDVTTVAGTQCFPNPLGNADGTGLLAQFTNPESLVFNPHDGMIYVCAQHAIRQINPNNWAVRTIAGVSDRPGSQDGTGTGARFSSPSGLALDTYGRLFVADGANNFVRMLTPDGVVKTIQSTNKDATAMPYDNGARPYDLVFDASGDLYVVMNNYAGFSYIVKYRPLD